MSNLSNKIGDKVCLFHTGKGGVDCGGCCFSETSPLRSVSGRGGRGRLRWCSHRRGGPLSPATTSCSHATRLTCNCLFSLKKCQSVRSQVYCSSSCFCCFSPLLSPFSPVDCSEIKATPLEESEYFRCGERAAFHTTCVALRDGSLLSLRLS